MSEITDNAPDPANWFCQIGETDRADDEVRRLEGVVAARESKLTDVKSRLAEAKRRAKKVKA